jgi:hypothetical protein
MKMKNFTYGATGITLINQNQHVFNIQSTKLQPGFCGWIFPVPNKKLSSLKVPQES